MKLDNKVILIVGASHGIARSIALKLAARNNKLVLTARKLDGLKAVKKEVEALGAECDIHSADALNEKLASLLLMYNPKLHFWAGINKFVPYKLFICEPD